MKKKLVVLTGAGMSAESGISTFRDSDGLWEKYRVEDVATPEGFAANPELVLNFYNQRRRELLNTKPNAGHIGLADLEQEFDVHIITQNIDNLHQMAGSKKVLELHGSVYRNYCMKCGKFYDFSYIKNSAGIPRCQCGGMVKPDVVLYEEGLDNQILSDSVRAISKAQVLIIGGTSLAVYPAASLIDYFRGDCLVVINKAATPRDRNADLLIKDPIGQVFSNIKCV